MDCTFIPPFKVWKNGKKSCILAHVQCLLYHHYSADQLTFEVLYGLQSLKRIFLRNLKKIRRSMSLLPMINKRSNEQLKSLKTTQEIHILKMSQFLSHLWHTKWLVTFTKQDRKFDFLLFEFWEGNFKRWVVVGKTFPAWQLTKVSKLNCRQKSFCQVNRIQNTQKRVNWRHYVSWCKVCQAIEKNRAWIMSLFPFINSIPREMILVPPWYTTVDDVNFAKSSSCYVTTVIKWKRQQG